MASVCARSMRAARITSAAIQPFRRSAGGWNSPGEMRDMLHKRLGAEKIGRKFDLSDDDLDEIRRRMTDDAQANETSSAEYRAGRATYIRCPRPVPPTAAAHTPATYGPSGGFLGLDLIDGRRFRTRYTTVSDTRDVMVRCGEHPVPRGLKTGAGRELLDSAAGALAEFAGRHGAAAAGLPLAFTFGFPVRHAALDRARLRRWTQGFDCADLVGRDVVAELRAALDRRPDVRVGPVALLGRASVAVLNGLAVNAGTRVAVVVDDGCDCAYVRTAAAAAADGWRGWRGRRHYDTVADTGWGAFGERGSLDGFRTEFDRSLDARSKHPGRQIFEKMTSGMYMAELVRLLVAAMAADKVLFDGRVTTAMGAEYALNAEHLSAVESDARRTYARGRAVLADALDVHRPTAADCELFRYACECVTKRSAHLVAAGLASVVQRLRPPPAAGAVAVAVGGSVFETHPRYAHAVGTMAVRLTRPLGAIKLRAAGHEDGALLVADLLARMPAAPKTTP